MPRIAVLLPVWNDWGCAARLLCELGRELQRCGFVADVLIADDASTVKPPADFAAAPIGGLSRVSIIRLACNLGHQRAIAVGLVHLAETEAEFVVVMDSDGEDKPSDVPALLEALRAGSSDVVFAGRLQRSESATFRACYGLYRFLHRVLTGVPVRFGNFSAIRRDAVRQLVWNAALWNHYAAAVVRSRLGYEVLPTARGERYEGRSTLNFSQLVAHGLGALSVFSETITARIFVLAAVLSALAVLCFVVLGASGGLAAAGAVAGVSLVGLLVASIGLAGMNLIAQRSFPGFIPARDAGQFAASEKVRLTVS